MKLLIGAVLCAAGAFACSHASRPQTVPAPLAPAAAPLPDEAPLTLTPASATGQPRPVAVALAPPEPAHDKAETIQDQESLREIREALAADKSLASTTSQVTIVVRDGRVQLRGQVNTAEERTAVEKAARRAGSVRDVKNEIFVME